MADLKRFEYDAEANKEDYRKALREYESREQATVLILAGNDLELLTDKEALTQLREVFGVSSE